MALDGRLCLSIKPPKFFSELQMWREHPENVKLNEIASSVEKMAKENRPYFNFETYDESDDEDEENDEGMVLPAVSAANFESNEEKETVDESDNADEKDDDDDDNGDIVTCSKRSGYGTKTNPYDLLGNDDGNN
jgi:hypothetical protein